MKSNNQKSLDLDSKKIKKMERCFYKAISEMKELDKLAVEINDWEAKYGHRTTLTPSIYDIEQIQRERLITALWYSQQLHVRDAEVDAYLNWKITVLATV